MERNGNKVLLTVIAIAVLIVATVGATFAYFSATGGTATQQIKTGELKVTASSSLKDGVNIKPTAWSKTDMAANYANTDIAKVDLTVDTTGTTIDTGKYTINLTTTGIALKAETATVKGGSLKDVKWALYDVTDAANPVSKAEGTFENEAYTEENGNAVNRAILTNVAIPGDDTKFVDKYTLYIWIENTNDSVEGNGDGVQDRLQGLDVTAKLTVDAMQ